MNCHGFYKIEIENGKFKGYVNEDMIELVNPTIRINTNDSFYSTCTGTVNLTVDKIDDIISEKMKGKGDNMEKIEKILERYKKYQIEEIDRQCAEDTKFIRETSDLAKIVKKLKTQVKKELTKLYPNSEYEDIKHYIYLGYENDDKTHKAIQERIEYRDAQIRETNKKIEDVKALISIAETFDQKMEILKSYEIIDEDGKIKEW